MHPFSLFRIALRWVASALGEQINGAITAVADAIGDIVRSLAYPLERILLQPSCTA